MECQCIVLPIIALDEEIARKLKPFILRIQVRNLSDLLVGISRNLTDFCYIAYLADLAVLELYQKMGIGKELIRRTQAELGTTCRLILLSAPKAAAYYLHIGFSRHPEAWTLAPGEQLQ